MNKIVVRNSCIVINNYTLGDCEELERNFMIYDPLTHNFVKFGMWWDEESNKLYIPRGLDIWKIKSYFGESTVYKEAPNNYLPINDIKMKVYPRDDEQKQALRFMVGSGEYENNAQEPQISVNLNTGKGKTFCSIATIGILQVKSIIITASVTLLKQWKLNIMEYTNLKEKDIFFLEGSNTLNMIAQGKSKRGKEASIFLCTHATLRSFGETFSWERLNNVFRELGIGAKFFDEAHTNYDNMLMVDFFTNVAKTYYVTATPARSDYRENKIYQLSMKNVPGIDLFDAENDPHTDYIAIKWNSKPTPQQISYCRNSYGLDRNKYTNYVVRQPNFYKIMRIIMDMVIKCNGRALMYIGTNEAIKIVYKWIGENYPEFLGNIGIYTSLISPDKKFLERDKKLLLSTTKSAGLGEHIEHLKMTIVLAEPFKSNVIAQQTLGRTRDKNTVYIELVDLGFKQTRNFYYSKLPVFNKYASDTSDTTIDQYELDNRSVMLEQSRNNWHQSPLVFRDERFFEYNDEEIKGGNPLIYYN